MEGREWVYVKGVWQEREIEETKQFIKKASSKDLAEAKMRAFNEFLNRLSNI
jgi:hypothetical protein